jgi:hypothetical protein
MPRAGKSALVAKESAIMIAFLNGYQAILAIQGFNG